MPQGPAHLQIHWQNNGPYSPDANALNHLRRFGFQINKGIITPPRGYELNKEDWMAIDYLVLEWDYAYAPSKDSLPTDTPGEQQPEGGEDRKVPPSAA